MLNSTRLLSYIKGNIGFPWQFVELTDDEILESVTQFTLRTFDHYFPDENTIGMSLKTTLNKVANKANEYYITDPEGREILNVSHIYFSGSNYMFFGHSPIGPMNLMEIPQWALSTEIAGWVKSFSSWNYTFVFKSPNIISIRPTPTSEDWVAIEYERHHADDFSTIPNDLQMYFLELSLADIMIKIGRIRRKYGAGGLKTPFGEITLSDEIYDEGKEKRAEIIEKLTTGSLTNVVVSFG
jgi:hypothetical protein